MGEYLLPWAVIVTKRKRPAGFRPGAADHVNILLSYFRPSVKGENADK
jgi:hypothetical protein